MKASKNNIDISENILRKTGKLLDILLFDHTTTKNIIWATNSYEKYGNKFTPQRHITPSLVTGQYETLIQPRATKSLEEQQKRTKDKAEVSTPLKIVDQINKAVDTKSINKNNWQEYVRELKLEITCGEAPFIVSRYDPTANTDKLLELKDRVGFLDKKLKIVSEYCTEKKDWLFWAKEAFKASYGYEWQGDNILLARENLLYTFIDFYKAKFGELPLFKSIQDIAYIISWNIWQMDGLKGVVPYSCVTTKTKTVNLFGEEEVANSFCKGCLKNNMFAHNGTYCIIMDWENKGLEGEKIKFIDLVGKSNI